MQASFFIQDKTTFNDRNGNESTLNTVAEILLQPDSNAGFSYTWLPAANLSSQGSSLPFVVNDTAPCCINLNQRLQSQINMNTRWSNEMLKISAPGWKHFGANVTGQVLGTCQMDTQNASSPKVVAAAFSWYRDAYNVTGTELVGPKSPLVLMITGDLTHLKDVTYTDSADSEGTKHELYHAKQVRMQHYSIIAWMQCWSLHDQHQLQLQRTEDLLLLLHCRSRLKLPEDFSSD